MGNCFSSQGGTKSQPDPVPNNDSSTGMATVSTSPEEEYYLPIRTDPTRIDDNTETSTQAEGGAGDSIASISAGGSAPSQHATGRTASGGTQLSSSLPSSVMSSPLSSAGIRGHIDWTPVGGNGGLTAAEREKAAEETLQPDQTAETHSDSFSATPARMSALERRMHARNTKDSEMFNVRRQSYPTLDSIPAWNSLIK